MIDAVENGDVTVYATGGFFRRPPFTVRDIRAAIEILRRESIISPAGDWLAVPSWVAPKLREAWALANLPPKKYSPTRRWLRHERAEAHRLQLASSPAWDEARSWGGHEIALPAGDEYVHYRGVIRWG